MSAFFSRLGTILTAILGFLIVFFIVVYGIGLVVGGFLLALLTAFLSALMSHYVGEYLKPKVRLKVSSYELIPREFGNLRGFQISLRFKNEGKRIATKPEVNGLVRREELPAQYLRVEIHSENGKKSFKSERVVNAGGFPWRWDIDKVPSGLLSSGEMRRGDEVQVTFPEESRAPFLMSSMSSGPHSVSYENIVEFKPGRYIVSVEIKCEDPQERTTVITNWSTKIDLTAREAYAKYWLGLT